MFLKTLAIRVYRKLNIMLFTGHDGLNSIIIYYSLFRTVAPIEIGLNFSSIAFSGCIYETYYGSGSSSALNC